MSATTKSAVHNEFVNFFILKKLFSLRSCDDSSVEINGFNSESAQQSKTIDSPFSFHLVTNGRSRFHLVACAFNPLKVVPAVMFVPLMHQLVYLLRPVIIVPFRVDKLVLLITLLTNTVYCSFLIREACF